jgi:hypothetical protein
MRNHWWQVLLVAVVSDKDAMAVQLPRITTQEDAFASCLPMRTGARC